MRGIFVVVLGVDLSLYHCHSISCISDGMCKLTIPAHSSLNVFFFLLCALFIC